MVAHTKHNQFCTTLFGGFDNLFGGITVLNHGFRPTPVPQPSGSFHTAHALFRQPTVPLYSLVPAVDRRGHEQDQLSAIFLCKRDCKAYSGI